MTEKENRSSSEQSAEEESKSIQAIYEAAQQLTSEGKAILVKRIVDTSEMGLSLRVEITESSKMTILNFDLGHYKQNI